MDLILLTDIKTLGKKGEKVTVKDGYGRNLISKKQAAPANAKTMNDLKLQKAHEEKQAEERLKNAEELKDKLAGLSITVKVKVGKDGKVFGSVTSKEVAEAISRDLKVDIDKKKIVMDPIKAIGVTPVNVKLHKDIAATVNVKVGEA